jgi:hypothetical protein
MNTKTKAGVWMLAMGVISAGMFFANSAKAATITSVSPEDIWADEAYTVALTGSGFDDATGMTLFRHTDYTPADEIRTVDVDFDVFSDDRAEIYVPAGLRTGWYDIWIDGNDGGGELENAVWIGSTALSSVTELNYTSSKKAKRTMSIEFEGLVLGKNKTWTTIKFNGRKATVKRVAKSRNNSTVTVEIKYGKWPKGFYNLSVKYKNQVREEIDKGNKTTYKKRWDSDSDTYNNIFEIK